MLSPLQIRMLKGLVCPYCHRPTQLVDSSEVYGRSYGMIYLCRPCNAYVGCHQGTTNALGRVANAELRIAKKLAYEKFDPLWRNGYMTRHEAYKWLSDKLGIPAEYTHIGMFNVDTCHKVVSLCINYLQEKL